MKDEYPDRDDPIHRVFRRLREGFSEIVVDIVGRVDERIQLFIEDDRHLPPRWDRIMSDMAKGAATILLPPRSPKEDDPLSAENTDPSADGDSDKQDGDK